MEGTSKKRVVKNINLLPLELRIGMLKKLMLYVQANPLKVVVTYLIAIFVFAVVMSISQSMRASSYIRNTVNVENELHKQQARFKETKGIINNVQQAKEYIGFQLSLLNKRLSFLSRQDNFGHHWAGTLRELGRLVPKGVWLISLRSEEPELKIAGGAFNENLVSDFMRDLRESPLFNNVSFLYTQDSKVGKTKVVLFELTANYNIHGIQAPKPQPQAVAPQR